MTLALCVGAGLLFAAAATVPPIMNPMTDTPQALTLDVRQHDGMLEVQLIGLSPHTQQVSYALEVTGHSTSRHRGSTTLSAGTSAVLSTMRAHAGENWCVKLVAEEEGRDPYEIMYGTCAAQ
jgi:hypothetical protein